MSVHGFVKDTVRMRQNSTDPRPPPSIVIHSFDPSWLLYSCMPAKTSTTSVAERRKESPLDTATNKMTKLS